MRRSERRILCNEEWMCGEFVEEGLDRVKFEVVDAGDIFGAYIKIRTFISKKNQTGFPTFYEGRDPESGWDIVGETFLPEEVERDE